MSENVALAKNKLFGVEGFAATNIKLFPGTSREITSDDLAEQISKSLTRFAVGGTVEVAANEE